MNKRQTIWGPCTEKELNEMRDIQERRQALVQAIQTLSTELEICHHHLKQWWAETTRKYNLPKEAILNKALGLFGTDIEELDRLEEEEIKNVEEASADG